MHARLRGGRARLLVVLLLMRWWVVGCLVVRWCARRVRVAFGGRGCVALLGLVLARSRFARLRRLLVAIGDPRRSPLLYSKASVGGSAVRRAGLRAALGEKNSWRPYLRRFFPTEFLRVVPCGCVAALPAGWRSR